MPTRKLVKHGPSTFIVSLPRPWVDSHELEKGDDISYEERPDSIVFYAESGEKQRKAEVDVTGLDRTSVLFALRGLYRQGYSEITLTFDEDETYHIREDEKIPVSSAINTEVERLIGVEVLSFERNSVTIKQMAEPSDDQLYQSMRRVFDKMSKNIQDLIEDIKNQDRTGLAAMEHKQDAITKIISYCLRIIRLDAQVKNGSYLTAALMQLETLNYLFLHFTRYLLQEEEWLSEDSIAVLKHTVTLQQLVTELFYDWSNESARRFNEVREKLQKSFTKVQDTEKHLIFFLEPVVTIQRSIIQARLSMQKEPLSS